eukprot:CAMPEP_0201125338 /NCGR_PEP_ID=MMETSP0850-20130426/20804_1 /ASSEMBLY_ACC=CAM_ASM_000622 /TAXON_ID=183588 /ORGANISM="Pseudo-nitzschia fraudulenta, Strain WWA7" /LENGTH=90 /DNA_ID=CAMNT_0047393305 /DNA_START=591 /DNA_END=863 /DNA_ORIENTATION=+
MIDVIDIHGEGGDVVHGVDDAGEGDVELDIRGVVGAVDGEVVGDDAVGDEGGEGIDDEGDDQNHVKLEPTGVLEVHRAIPILEAVLQVLD